MGVQKSVGQIYSPTLGRIGIKPNFLGHENVKSFTMSLRMPSVLYGAFAHNCGLYLKATTIKGKNGPFNIYSSWGLI